ncbi:MAG: hypothetical protein GTO14_10605 [Anaerolineales bacterium]|nr:hypothetical protein [Anaerolineales bacterium]
MNKKTLGLKHMQIKDEAMNTPSRLILALFVLTITGCTQVKRATQQNNVNIVGSGDIVSQSRPLSGFNRLEAGLVFDLAVRQGDEFSVVFVADDNWVDYLSARVDGTTLVFDYKDGYAYNVSNVTTRVEVTMPELAGLSLGESSRAYIEGFETTGTFEAELTGSSRLDGNLAAETTRLAVFGSGSVQLSGSSETLELESCGNSLVDLRSFEVDHAILDLACSSSAVVLVTGRLNVEAAQHSQVFFRGNPASSAINVYESASVDRLEE